MKAKPVKSAAPSYSFVSEDLPVFTTDIRIFRFDTEPGFNERLAEACLRLHENKIKNRYAFFDYNLWHEDMPELGTLKKMFMDATNSYVDSYFNPMIKQHFRCEMHAWLRIDEPKEIIPPHAHIGSNLAITYYCQTDIAARKSKAPKNFDAPVEGDLMVMDPRPIAQKIFWKSKRAISISPEVGMLVIMPGFLTHWTNPVSAGDVRICIANDTCFRRKTSLSIVEQL